MKYNNKLQYRQKQDSLSTGRLSSISSETAKRTAQLQRSEEYNFQIEKKHLMDSTIKVFESIKQHNNADLNIVNGINSHDIHTEFSNIWDGRISPLISPAGKLTILLLLASIGISAVGAAPISQQVKELLKDKVPNKVADNFAKAIKYVPHNEAEYMLLKIKESDIHYKESLPETNGAFVMAVGVKRGKPQLMFGSRTITASRIRHEAKHFAQQRAFIDGKYDSFGSGYQKSMESLKYLGSNLKDILEEFSASQIQELNNLLLKKYLCSSQFAYVSPSCKNAEDLVKRNLQQDKMPTIPKIGEVLVAVLDQGYIADMQQRYSKVPNRSEEIGPFFTDFFPIEFLDYLEQTSHKEDLQSLIDKVRITENLYESAVKSHKEKLLKKRSEEANQRMEL